jgi:cell division protein FtsI (penicillin-binding protein 3)
MLLWTIVLVARLADLQVVKHSDLLKQAQHQHEKTLAVEAVRGTIFDRTGLQPLAKTLPAESICVNPFRIPDPDLAATLLSRLLDLDRKKLLDRITKAKAHKAGFMWVKRKVMPEEADRLRSLKLEWVEFRSETRRFHPHGPLAAHVVGSTGFNDENPIEHGTGGLELSFDEDLSGRAGINRVYTDVRQTVYDADVVRPPEPGANLVLTLDLNLQFEAERALEAAALKHHAKSGSIVVLDPYTGDILAMANWPSFDPNQIAGPDEVPFARTNLAVTTPFEPGSVFKVITLAAALETTSLTPESTFDVGNGHFKVLGRVVQDHAHGTLSMAEILARSSNGGAIQIGLKVGQQNLYNYVRKFGFGRKTGVDLPGESPGMLRRVEKWEPTSLPSVAMGHEVGATSIQLALAGAVVANGGMLMKPRLILARQKPGGAQETYPPEKGERIIKPETAIQLRQMMEGVVLHGTGREAILPGYTSGGKTGSAQIYDLKTHTYTHNYNASFVGFAPVANPQVVVAVTLIGTSGGEGGYGGAVAAPVFRKVTTAALRMMDVPRDLPDVRTAKANKTDVNDLPMAGFAPPSMELAQTLKESSAQIAAVRSEAHAQNQPSSVAGKNSRVVSSVTPPPVPSGSTDAPLKARSGDTGVRSELTKGSEGTVDRRPFFPESAEPKSVAAVSAGSGRVVPDFRGKSLRDVLEESVVSGLPVEVTGDGLARNQEPAPGTLLSRGARVRVQFSR